MCSEPNLDSTVNAASNNEGAPTFDVYQPAPIFDVNQPIQINFDIPLSKAKINVSTKQN